MFSRTFVKTNIIDRSKLILLFLLPLLISCTPDQNTDIEIITPPIFPKDFSSIPEQTDDAQLISLLSAEDKILDIRVGRKDPFLPLNLEGDQLLVPSSFKYHGYVSSSNLINAFVSYEDRNGTIKPGDIGGENTDLLPKGWTLLSLDSNRQVLTLVFENQEVEVDLFPN